MRCDYVIHKRRSQPSLQMEGLTELLDDPISSTIIAHALRASTKQA